MKPHEMIAIARSARRQTQAELAERLTEVTGEPWTRNGVAAIENGRRKFEAGHLAAFAQAQDVDTTWYLDPPAALLSGDELRPYHVPALFSLPAAA